MEQTEMLSILKAYLVYLFFKNKLYIIKSSIILFSFLFMRMDI